MRKFALGCLLGLITVTLAAGALAADEPRGYQKGQGYQFYEIGTYPQGKDGEASPLLWRALAVENGEALLLTEMVIDAKQVIFEQDEDVIAKHAYRRIASFADSDLCQWMNGEMLTAILGDTGLESALVAGEFGKLYPLTDKQLLKAEYGFSTARFGSVPVRRATATAYAKSVGAYCDTNGSTPYWVATVKTAEGYKLQIVGFNGHLSYGAYTRTNIGIRAAMTLNLAQCVFTDGEGTLENPFRIALATPAATAQNTVAASTSAVAQATPVPTATATPASNGTVATVAALAEDAETTPEAVSAASVSENSASAPDATPTEIVSALNNATETLVPTVSGAPMSVEGEQSASSATAGAALADPGEATAQETADAESNENGAETVTLSLLGDCSIGDGYRSRNASGSLTSVIAKQGTAWPFSLLAQYLTADDLTVANLEVCLTDSDNATDKMFPMIAPPENVAVLTQGGVDAVNTVNNHCFDFGQSGYADTLETLDHANILHFGSAILGGRLVSDLTAQVEIKGIRFGFIGYSYPQNDTLEAIGERIQALRNDGCDVVIVSLHWGRETYTTPKSGQPSYAAKIIDLGADVVWGHHPHVLQPVQFYQGKPVMFSTGNFVFGTMGPVDPSTGIFQLRYQKTENGVVLRQFRVIPCETQSGGDYRPFELTDDAEREKVWKMLRAKKTYADYQNLPDSFTTSGTVTIDLQGNLAEEP